MLRQTAVEQERRPPRDLLFSDMAVFRFTYNTGGDYD